MEVLGGVSSIITIIDTSIKLVGYYNDVKGAEQDIKRLLHFLESLHQTYEALEGNLKQDVQSRSQYLKTSQSLSRALQESKDVLLEVQKGLKKNLPNDSSRDTAAGSSSSSSSRTKAWVKGKFSVKSMKWPFKAKQIQDITKSLERDQAILSQALMIDVSALSIGITTKISESDYHYVLSKLPIAEGAAIGSQANEHEPRCHKETRRSILEEISAWNQDADGKSIFWLCGMAGTGKSTICRTVADKLKQEGLPFVSYFFKRGEGDRGNAQRFFTTLAAQLVTRVPQMSTHVSETIKKDPMIVDASKVEQFTRLILEPLKKVCEDQRAAGPDSITILIDALDECESSQDAKTIIKLFSIAKETMTTGRLKFLVTSRPEAHLRIGFKEIGSRFTDLTLHEVPLSDIKHDIGEFFVWKLGEIRNDYNNKVEEDQLASTWPGIERTARLVDMAVPLFIFAATACRFIADTERGDPSEQLERMLSHQVDGGSKMRQIYLPILQDLLVERTPDGVSRRFEKERREIISRFTTVIGSVVLLAEPLSVKSLATLLQLSSPSITALLAHMHSVLHIPSNTSKPVKLLHLSFRDFLVDPEERTTNELWIDEQQGHATLASFCLSLLCKGQVLHKDMCCLELPGRQLSELSLDMINGRIPYEVQYACRYWVHHVSQNQHRLVDGCEAHAFLERHVLHWLEVLALLGQMGETLAMIENLLRVVDVR
jgi:hypothetical protein